MFDLDSFSLSSFTLLADSRLIFSLSSRMVVLPACYNRIFMAVETQARHMKYSSPKINNFQNYNTEFIQFTHFTEANDTIILQQNIPESSPTSTSRYTINIFFFYNNYIINHAYMCVYFFIVLFDKILITTHTPMLIFLPKLVSSIARKCVKTIVHNIVNIKYYKRDVYACDLLEYNPKCYSYIVVERKKLVIGFLSTYRCTCGILISNHRRPKVFLSPDIINRQLYTTNVPELLLKSLSDF